MAYRYLIFWIWVIVYRFIHSQMEIFHDFSKKTSPRDFSKMPPPHLTARVIHGWLIIINNHPSLTYVSSQNIYVNKVIIPSNKVMFFLRQPPKSADCVNLIFSVQRFNSFQWMTSNLTNVLEAASHEKPKIWKKEKKTLTTFF